MKKILCVMVAVALCFGAVLVTASAEEAYSYNGVSMPYPPECSFTDYYVIFLEAGGGYTLVTSTSRFTTDNLASKVRVQNSDIVFYNLVSGEWVKFAEYTYTDLTTVGDMDNLFWSSRDIKNVINAVKYSGDPNFKAPKPMHEVVGGVTGEAVNGFVNDTFDALGVLVPIGIGIMAIFLGVALIPRVIYKFL